MISQSQYQSCVNSLQVNAALRQGLAPQGAAAAGVLSSINNADAACRATITQYQTEQAAIGVGYGPLATTANPLTAMFSSISPMTLLMIGGLGVAAYLLLSRRRAPAAATAGYGRYRRSRR